MNHIDMEYTFQLQKPEFDLRFTDTDPFFKKQYMYVSVRELVVTSKFPKFPDNVFTIVCKNKSNLVFDPNEGIKTRFCNLALFSMYNKEAGDPIVYALHSTPMKVFTTTGKLTFELCHLEGRAIEFNKFESVWVRLGLSHVQH